MTEISLSLYGLDRLCGNRIEPVLDIVREIDASSVDTLIVTDHVVMGEHTEAYPYGDFPTPPDTPWWEPMILLAHIAAISRRVQLGTGILIAPLRPPALLAKQCTTLDQLCGGRLVLGVGSGWQREEFQACNVSFENRFQLMREQLRACRAMWNESPATHHSEHVNFDRIYCRPGPCGERRIPLWFGLKATQRNAQFIAEVGDGWLPIINTPETELERSITLLRHSYDVAGRDPSSLRVKVSLIPHRRDEGMPDLDVTVKDMRRLQALGVTDFEFNSSMFVQTPEDVPSLLSWLDAVRAAINA